MTHLIVPRGSRLSNQQVKNIILDDKTILIFTMYSLASAPLLDQIRDIPYKKNMANFTILGSPAWAFETEAVVGPKTMRLPTSYAFGPWNPNSSREKTKLFTSRFNSKFGTSPRADVVYSYDTLTLALPCLDNSSTRDEATKCLAKPMSLDGVAGRLEFDGTHSHSKRAPILFSFHNGKMEVLE
jgi:ABC-type branched-subunit amino acid transport system substrate-binding protein